MLEIRNRNFSLFGGLLLLDVEFHFVEDLHLLGCALLVEDLLAAPEEIGIIRHIEVLDLLLRDRLDDDYLLRLATLHLVVSPADRPRTRQPAPRARAFPLLRRPGYTRLRCPKAPGARGLISTQTPRRLPEQVRALKTALPSPCRALFNRLLVHFEFFCSKY